MWHPSISLTHLRARAELIANIREFFKDRAILEVDTPILGKFTATDPYIESMCEAHTGYYLQTSPEYAMKRLLAAGVGPIYQIAKVFRAEESGTSHNPEFTLLEWYRPGFNHHELMDEMDDLLRAVAGWQRATRLTYQECFQQYCRINPHTVTLIELQKLLNYESLSKASRDSLQDKDTCLQWLMRELVEPNLQGDRPYYIYDYPASQCALASIRNDEYPVAERFELYYKGMELANGFHELIDPEEQTQRFKKDLEIRAQRGQNIIEIDEYFITALQAGLPKCSGVALGIERLFMAILNLNSIDEIIAFPWHQA